MGFLSDLFGGSSGPKAHERLRRDRETARTSWERYQQTLYDLDQSYTRSSRTSRSRLAASGLRPGSATWDMIMEEQQKDYETQRDEYKGGATRDLLDMLVEDQKRYYVSAAQEQAADPSSSDAPLSYYNTQILRKAGVINWYINSGMTEQEFMAMDTIDFLSREFGTLDLEPASSGPSSASVSSSTASRRTAAAGSTPNNGASPWV